MTPDPHPIRGFVCIRSATPTDDPHRWLWEVTRHDRSSVLNWGAALTLPAAYDRCAAAVTKAREEEA